MSDYTQSTDFSLKDSLATGDPDKLIIGADLDTELGLILTAIATKAEGTGPAMEVTATGTFTPEYVGWFVNPESGDLRYIVYSDGTHKIWMIMASDGLRRAGGTPLQQEEHGIQNLPTDIQAPRWDDNDNAMRSQAMIMDSSRGIAAVGVIQMGVWEYYNSVSRIRMRPFGNIAHSAGGNHSHGMTAGTVIIFQDLINNRT